MDPARRTGPLAVTPGRPRRRIERLQHILRSSLEKTDARGSSCRSGGRDECVTPRRRTCEAPGPSADLRLRTERVKPNGSLPFGVLWPEADNT